MRELSLAGSLPTWGEFPDLYQYCGVCFIERPKWRAGGQEICTDCAVAVGHRGGRLITAKWPGRCIYCEAPVAEGDQAYYGHNGLYCLSDECAIANLRSGKRRK